MVMRAIFIGLVCAATAVAQDWQTPVRAEASGGNLDRALALVEQRLRESPADLEAQGWRARLLAWTKHWSEAETGYRQVLERAPNDVDILCGLSDVLLWQGRDAEALAVLDRARVVPPLQTEVLNRRGRVLARLGRAREARAEFAAALRLDAHNQDAQTGLHALPQERRQELRFGVDTDDFNYSDTASAQSVTWISRWNDRWTTTLATASYQRFGAIAQRVTGRVSRRLGSATWVAVGSGIGHDAAVIPRRELAFEFGSAVHRSPTGLFRGVEFILGQQSLWFRDARVQTLSGTQTLYLPRDWSWSVTLTGARSSFPAVGAEWTPSGNTRLGFPLRGERLRGNLLFAVGAEDFAKTDQVGHFAARTFGGGLRFQLTRSQDIAGYVAQQNRSQGRSQSSFGFSYGVRF